MKVWTGWLPWPFADPRAVSNRHAGAVVSEDAAILVAQRRAFDVQQDVVGGEDRHGRRIDLQRAHETLELGREPGDFRAPSKVDIVLQAVRLTRVGAAANPIDAEGPTAPSATTSELRVTNRRKRCVLVKLSLH